MRKIILLSVSLVFISSFLRAAGALEALKSRVKETTLSNGLKVILVERKTVPVVSFHALYKAGGVDEVSGKTGLAHMFEHMLFKGTQTVGTKNYAQEKIVLDLVDKKALELIAEQKKGAAANPEKLKALWGELKKLEAQAEAFVVPNEFDGIYQRNGAVGLNAFTGQDVTGFVVSLPANKWRLWAMLEADRMKSPVLRQFYKERSVVMEERRMRNDNSPHGKLWENFIALAFQAHPYRSPTIGWMSDLQGLTRADAQAFFAQHYNPSNAVVAMVGDINAAEVAVELEKEFAGTARSTPVAPSAWMTDEPPQAGEKRAVVYFDAEPSLLMGFHKPAPPHHDNTVLEIVSEILSRGRSSRFNRRVVEKEYAVSAWAANGVPGERYDNLFVVGGSAQHPVDNRQLEDKLWQELLQLQKEPVKEAELSRVLRQIEAEWIQKLSSNGGLASELAYYQAVRGGWRSFFEYLDDLRQVTPADVQRVAQKYFTPQNRTVVYIQRQEKSQ